jgi:transposase
MTHDYKRHGTTTLFAALDVATGEVLHECMDRYRHQEFLRFARRVVQTVDRDLEVHFILDNYSTHKHPKVRAWLEKNPPASTELRVHFHFVPTYASWLNLVERFFSELTVRLLKRLTVNSVGELIARIKEYIEHRNSNPRPFTWSASVQSILRKVAKAKRTLATPLAG